MFMLIFAIVSMLTFTSELVIVVVLVCLWLLFVAEEMLSVAAWHAAYYFLWSGSSAALPAEPPPETGGSHGTPHRRSKHMFEHFLCRDVRVELKTPGPGF